MPTQMTSTANAAMTRRDGPMSRRATTGSKPFVVTSLTTRRYPFSKRVPIQKSSAITLPTSTRGLLSVSRGAPTYQASRPGSLSTVVPKAEHLRLPTKPLPIRAPGMAIRVKNPPLSPRVPLSPCWKPFVPRSLQLVERSREGKLICGYSTTASTVHRSTRGVNPAELPPRPSCVPCCRINQSPACVLGPTIAKQGVPAGVSTARPRPCNPEVARTMPSVHVGTVNTAFVREPVTAGDRPTGMPTGSHRPTVFHLTTRLQAVDLISPVVCSPPLSPDLSSFPSQSWTIVVDANVRRVKTATTTSGDKTLSSVGDAPKYRVAETPNDLYGYSESDLSSPSVPFPTVIGTVSSPAELIVGADSASKINSPSAEISQMVCAATIVAPSINGSPCSIATLEKVMHRSRASSPSTGNGTRTMVQAAIKIARSFFSPSQRAPQSGTETASPSKVMGASVSRIRKLFTPSLDKDAKTAMNPTAKAEIEMLRARKKVAGGGVIDPRLGLLGSLTAVCCFGPDLPSGHGLNRRSLID